MDVDEFTDMIVNIAAEDEPKRLWTEDEENTLRSLHGHITDEQIGVIIGRTRNAVHIHAERELHLPSPTTDPDYITCRKIAELLGIDNHIPPSWVDRGIMPGEYMPRQDNQLHRRTKRSIFINWLLNPDNWIWFNIHCVPDPNLHELLIQAERDWGDEWWTTNQAAAFHYVNNKDVLRYIKFGWIKAIQAHNRSGRNSDYWANWFIKRSEATRPDLQFFRRSKMNIWIGTHIGVREVEKRKPVRKIVYGLYRPGNSNYWILALYEDRSEAIFIAKFIEEHGGSFVASMRKSARQAWKNYKVNHELHS